jgi:hypothetical protein
MFDELAWDFDFWTLGVADRSKQAKKLYHKSTRKKWNNDQEKQKGNILIAIVRISEMLDILLDITAASKDSSMQTINTVFEYMG